MNIERINQLKSFLENNPNDSFVLHALGLEYRSYEPHTAENYFQQVITNDPNYVGTYYHMAEVLIELDKIDQAKSVYEKGIKIAEDLRDAHSLRELKNAYQNFMIEFD